MSLRPTLPLTVTPQRILLITLRYLGDTVLTTPLINSLRAAYPNAQIDVLLYENTRVVFEGNAAVSNLITTTPKPTKSAHFQLAKRLFRQYDLAIATQTSDKVALYALLAAPLRIGFVPPKPQTGWLKRYLFQRHIETPAQAQHTVLSLLQLCDVLAIAPVYRLTPPRLPQGQFAPNALGLTEPYAVLHVMPQWRYKQWTRTAWLAVANYLHARGVQVVLSGGPVASEVDYLNALQAEMPPNTLNLAGRVSLAGMTAVIENARLFVGVDTGTTHLAAATGVPVVAIFGPTNPAIWSPWPVYPNGLTPSLEPFQAPFKDKGYQRVGNIHLVQGQHPTDACVPCQLEGCLRHRGSHSVCLDTLSAETVIAELASILGKDSSI
jgi:heptosyltransferase-3